MEKILYTVKEVSALIKTDTGYVYNLIKKGMLPALKLGSLKVRREALLDFLMKYEGKDLTKLDEVKPLELEKVEEKKPA